MPEITASRYVESCTWEDVPHLDAQTKRELWASTPPHLRQARAEGIPSLGAGAIYPIPLESVSVEPFAIPAWWPRLYAMDVGWNVTAALWLTYDPETRVRYAYAEYKRAQAEPLIHARAIKARGAWVPGVVDPAADRWRSRQDGEKLFGQYTESEAAGGLGLRLSLADNAVEAGIHQIWTDLSTGQLKLFATLVQTREEYRVYRRDEKGKIVKEFDDLMDCLRYGAMAPDSAFGKRPVDTRQTAAPAGPADQRAGY